MPAKKSTSKKKTSKKTPAGLQKRAEALRIFLAPAGAAICAPPGTVPAWENRPTGELTAPKQAAWDKLGISSLLEKTGTTTVQRKKGKSTVDLDVDLYRLSDQGLQVLRELEAEILKPVIGSAEGILKTVSDIQSSVSAIRNTVSAQLASLESRVDALASAAGSTFGNVCSELRTQVGAPATTPNGASPVADALRAAMARYRSDGRKRLDFSELYKAASPKPDPGEFTDAVWALSKAGEIDLAPWTTSWRDIPQPELALFRGSDVYYHVSLEGAS